MKHSFWARLFVLRWVRFVVLFVLVAPIAILVFGNLMMFLWNKTLVPVLHVSTISFWQGLGLLVLSKILFGNFSSASRSRSSYWKEKMLWRNMTPEQKERFKEAWKNRSRRWGYRSTDSECETEQPGDRS